MQLQSVGTGEQVTPDTDHGAHRGEQETPLAPTRNDENRQLRTELEAMRTTMKATNERHGKEIAKLKTLVNANVQSEPRAANADVNARLLPDARPMHRGDEEDLSLSNNEHASLDFTEPFRWRKNAWHCSSTSSSRDSCQVLLSPELEHDAARAGLASSRSLLGRGWSLQGAEEWDGKTCYIGEEKDTSKQYWGEVPLSCKTCTSKEHWDCTSCAEGTFLAAKKFTEKNNTKVPSGPCLVPPELKDFDPSLGGSKCSYSGCREVTATGASQDVQATRGEPLPATDQKLVCSRLCLFGGDFTTVKDLRRYDDPESKTGERKVDSKFTSSGGCALHCTRSSPVCAVHKTTMCTKNEAFHTGNCTKFREKQAGGKAEHCRQYNCDVQKEVNCVAILPYGAQDLTVELGTNLSAYMNECKHAINPCGTLPMLV